MDATFSEWLEYYGLEGGLWIAVEVYGRGFGVSSGTITKSKEIRFNVKIKYKSIGFHSCYPYLVQNFPIKSATFGGAFGGHI